MPTFFVPLESNQNARRSRREASMARPYWSGQIQISLVNFGVKLFVATEAKSEIRFHQVSRKSGERVRHQKVSSGDDTPVDKDEIVKGYEYAKGEYITIEPEEVEHLRIASKHTLEVTQFVDVDELHPELFEKPYFVTPENDAQSETFAVVRKALADTKKAALGKIAFGGREHLMAVMAPDDDKLPGLMAYAIRYAAELREAKDYFSEIKKVSVDSDQLALAKELIKRKTAKFESAKFKDTYEIALRELVDAKLKKKPLPVEEKAAPRGKVINLMDALKKSLGEKGASKAEPAKTKSPHKGIALVKSTKRATHRKSA
jgi:DNA end-binding protein Ku